MKLKDGFITHTAAGRHVMVSTGANGFSGLVRSNATAAYIVEKLKEDTTPEAIVEDMLSVYDAPREKIRRDVDMVIETLRGIGALVE